MGPAALLFDLDGTLVDSAPGIASALSNLSVARGGDPVEVDLIRQLVSQGVEVLVRRGLGPVAGQGERDVAEFRAILRDVPADPACIFPDVVDALGGLQGRGHRCAVITNKPEELSRRLLQQLDLEQFFDAIVGGDTLAVCKPDPSPLLHGLSAMGAFPGHAIMIGDSDVDAMAAQRAGLPFLLYAAGYAAHACGEIPVAGQFSVFAELPNLVAEWDRQKC